MEMDIDRKAEASTTELQTAIETARREVAEELKRLKAQQQEVKRTQAEQLANLQTP
jgi:uncharacterized membrane protein (DUF106 family)